MWTAHLCIIYIHTHETTKLCKCVFTLENMNANKTVSLRRPCMKHTMPLAKDEKEEKKKHFMDESLWIVPLNPTSFIDHSHSIWGEVDYYFCYPNLWKFVVHYVSSLNRLWNEHAICIHICSCVRPPLIWYRFLWAKRIVTPSWFLALKWERISLEQYWIGSLQWAP